MIYLAGACACEPDGGRGWRKEFREKFNNATKEFVHVIDPTQYFDYENPKKYQIDNKQIMTTLLHYVKKSDIVVVNLDNSIHSCGTCMELMYAKELGIPVIGFGDSEVYPWARECCWVVLDDVDSVIDYIFTFF